jgi:hypothetical protein
VTRDERDELRRLATEWAREDDSLSEDPMLVIGKFAGAIVPLLDALDAAERERDTAARAVEKLVEREAAAESSLASAREEARGLREALNGATAVWFGTQLYPAFSGEKNRRMDAAMERARAVLPPSPAPEAGPPTTCGGCAYFAPWENGIDGDCRPNGINTGHVYATEEACAEPGPRAPAPAASAETREEG